MPTRADPYDDTPEGAPPVPRTMASIQAAEIRRLRSSHEYQSLRAQFRNGEEVRWVDGKRGAPCWLCGGDIDYRLQHPHPYSWSLDHAISVHERPDLLMDVGNFRSSHLDCNQQRGTDDPALDIGVPSEIWGFALFSAPLMVKLVCAAYAIAPHAAVVLAKG